MTFTESAASRAVRGPARRRASRDGVRLGLLTALVSAVAVWGCWEVFVNSAAGQRVDQAALTGALYGRSHLWPAARQLLDVISVAFIALVLLTVVLIAAIRRRWMLAIQVTLLLGGANLTTQLLKAHVFVRPDLGGAPSYSNTLPSGHTTAAASVSAALLLVVPPRARPWVAIAGASYTAATGVSTLIGQWHRPSDVLAALFVVLSWSGLASALVATGLDAPLEGTATGAVRQVRPGGRRDTLSLSLLASVAALAGLPAVVALRRTWTTTGRIESGTALVTAYAGGALGVVAATFATFALLLVVRRTAGRATALGSPQRTSRVLPA
ncbi:MAG: phosphatase PAP2 family protein [Cellulomonas sp.]